MDGWNKGRGNRILLPKSILDEIAKIVSDREQSMEELGIEMARAVSRSTPFAKSAVSQFLSGKRVTDDILMAFCAVSDLTYPIISSPSFSAAVAMQSLATIARLDPERADEYKKELESVASALEDLDRAERRRSRKPGVDRVP